MEWSVVPSTCRFLGDLVRGSKTLIFWRQVAPSFDHRRRWGLRAETLNFLCRHHFSRYSWTKSSLHLSAWCRAELVTRPHSSEWHCTVGGVWIGSGRLATRWWMWVERRPYHSWGPWRVGFGRSRCMICGYHLASSWQREGDCYFSWPPGERRTKWGMLWLSPQSYGKSGATENKTNLKLRLSD